MIENRQRRDFEHSELHKDDLLPDPFKQFEAWLGEAADHEDILEPIATCLSTVSEEMKPHGRIVYLLGETDRGYEFYTNYNSQKGKDLQANPFASMTFFWDRLERQVRIEGRVEKVSADASDAYFAMRPRGNQLGAWASEQSSEIENEATLEERIRYFDEKFTGIDVPRPEHWGGYELIADVFEFWQGRPSRLHDRFRYTKEGNAWKITRLSP